MSAIAKVERRDGNARSAEPRGRDQEDSYEVRAKSHRATWCAVAERGLGVGPKEGVAKTQGAR